MSTSNLKYPSRFPTLPRVCRIMNDHVMRWGAATLEQPTLPSSHSFCRVSHSSNTLHRMYLKQQRRDESISVGPRVRNRSDGRNFEHHVLNRRIGLHGTHVKPRKSHIDSCYTIITRTQLTRYHMLLEVETIHLNYTSSEVYSWN